MKVILKKIPLYESFDFDSDEDESFDAVIESHRYKKFLDSNYEITGEIKPYKEDGELFIDVDGNVIVKNLDIKSLTNGKFRFGEVLGDFLCPNCMRLRNFNGGPVKVGGDFDCEMSSNIYSFEGAPEWIGGDLNCWGCENLSSYDGFPEVVKGRIDVYGTSLDTSILESFDFNSEADNEEDLDGTISNLKPSALIEKAIQESVKISVDTLPRKMSPNILEKNIDKLSKVIDPLRSLIKTTDSSNDIELYCERDNEKIQCNCIITNGNSVKEVFMTSSFPATPMYVATFILKIYLVVLYEFKLMKDICRFTDMITKEIKILLYD